MIPGPKIIAIDDTQEHLDAICSALHKLNTSCLPIKIDEHTGDIKGGISGLRGVRLIFLDIELIKGAADKNNYQAVGNILLNILGEDNGPYFLITWSRNADDHDDLMKFLSTRFPDLPPPIASALLEKTPFLTPGGAVKQNVETAISSRITQLQNNNPQALSMLMWDEAVGHASGSLLSGISELVENSQGVTREQMFLGKCQSDFEKYLKRIAQCAVGVTNVQRKISEAVNEGFIPLLYDRLGSIPLHSPGLEDIWTKSISNPDKKVQISNGDVAKINKMFHFSENVSHLPLGTRGLLYEVPPKHRNFDFDTFVGYPGSEMFKKFIFKRVEDCKQLIWRFVSIRAACDQAQPKEYAPHKILLALEINADFDYKNIVGDNPGPKWVTLTFENENIQKKLIFNWNCSYFITDRKLKLSKFKPLYRLRNSICSELEYNLASHITRPGIINMSG